MSQSHQSVAAAIAIPRTAKEAIDYWKGFYLELFGINANFEKLNLFDIKRSCHHYLLFPAGLTITRVLEVIGRRGIAVVNTFPGLENIYQERNMGKDCALLIDDCQEPDTDLVGMSGNAIIKEGIPCMSALEYLVYFLEYHYRNREMLDVHNITLCCGSSDEQGRIPGINWNRSKNVLEIDFYSGDDIDGSLRPRSVIVVE